MSHQAVHEQPHLLVVDDRPDEVRLLVAMLRSARYRISIAMDGHQAYRRAVATLPDLILMDVQMPHADGFAACRLLQADPSTAHIPIIFLTAAGQLDERLEGFKNGCVDYILKPYAAEEVLARVRIHLRNRNGAPPRAVGRQKLHDARPACKRPPRSPDQLIADAAAAFLCSHISAEHTLESVGRAVGTHEKRLSRAFRAHLGMSVFEFIRKERLETARRLLAETSLRITDIAEEVGFSTAANFATAFRDRYGMTPTTFREVGGAVTSAGLARRLSGEDRISRYAA